MPILGLVCSYCIIIKFVIWEKLLRAHQTLSGHFAPVDLDGSNKLRAYLFFIYEYNLSSLFFSDRLRPFQPAIYNSFSGRR